MLPIKPTQDRKVSTLIAPKPRLEATKSRSVSNPNISHNIITKDILCRICEKDVPGHLFKSHTELCSVKVQWEVRAIECDVHIEKIHRKLLKLDQSKPSVMKLRDVASVAKERFIENIQTVIPALTKLVDIIRQNSKKDPVIFTIAKDLKSWLFYKEEAWQMILKATGLLKTFIGLSSSQEIQGKTVLLTHIPSIRDFEIMKPITKGGYARIYLAKKKTCDDYYAIKVLEKQDIKEKTQIENVLAERNILATTSCPFVVRLYYSFQTKDNLFLAMEFLSGGDFFSLLSALGCFDEDFTRFYAAECVLALEYLHDRSIIHRGIYI